MSVIRYERKDPSACIDEAVVNVEAELNNVGLPGYSTALLALESLRFMLEREADSTMISGAFKLCLLDTIAKAKV